MPQTTYYIDAYNVIYQSPKLRDLARSDFESARDEFVERVVRFCALTSRRAKIVFDGRGHARNSFRPLDGAAGVEVVYTPGHLTADAVIERMVYNAAGGRREIVVVSGDRGIRELCGAMGSLVMAAVNFLELVDGQLSEASSHLREKSQTGKRTFLSDRLNERSLNAMRRLRDELDDRK